MHDKKDSQGNPILDAPKKDIEADYSPVKTGRK
jgi:hypothetical protein